MRNTRASCTHAWIMATVAAGLIGGSRSGARAADAPPPAATGRLASRAWLAGPWGHDSAGVMNGKGAGAFAPAPRV